MVAIAIATAYRVHSRRRDDSEDGAGFEAGNADTQDISAEIRKSSECSEGIIILVR